MRKSDYYKFIDYFIIKLNLMGESRIIKKYPLMVAMVMAKLSYLNKETIKNYLASIPGAKFKVINIREAQALYVEFKYNSFVAFRGTKLKDIFNLIAIFNIESVNYYGYDVDAGFARYTELLRPKLNKIINRQKSLHICGHSLGGAMASLYSLGENYESVTTFGCPKFINKFSTNNFPQVNMTRVINGNDWIHLLPPFVYEGAGKIIKFPRKENIFSSHFTINYLSAVWNYYKLIL